jgi:iron complex outermembrane receptor protein
MILPILLLAIASAGDSLCKNVIDTTGSKRPDAHVYELGAIVVTAPRMSSQASVREINADAMRDKSARSVADALEGESGVTVTYGAKGETDVYLRGMNSQRTLVLVDGRPVNMPYYGKVDMNTILLDNVSRIIVTKGSPSLLYGVNGTAGTINIITKRPEDADGFRIDIRGSSGNNATVGGLADAELRLGKTSLSASANREISDGFSLSRRYVSNGIENGGLRDNTDYDRLNISGKLGASFGDDTEAAIAAGYFHDSRGVQVDTRLPQYRRFPEWKRSYADATGRMCLIGDSWIKAKLFYDNFRNVLLQWTDAVNGMPDTLNSPSIH